MTITVTITYHVDDLRETDAHLHGEGSVGVVTYGPDKLVVLVLYEQVVIEALRVVISGHQGRQYGG